MKTFKIFLLFILLFGMFAFPISVTAQTYRFEVTVMEVEVYIEEDGSLSIWYLLDFQNRANADPIDFVDIGMPSSAYSLSAIQAEVDGKPITEIESSPYVPNGFALGLGADSIQPGQTGRVTVWIPGVRNVLSRYDSPDRENYTNFQFTPTWIDSEYEKSTSTEYRFTVILPPGVGDDEGVYYEPQRWPGSASPDDIGRTEAEGRIYYSWFTDNANAHTEYLFGAAFPNQYVPEDTLITEPPQTTQPGIVSEPQGFIPAILSAIGGNICCFGFGLVFIAIFGLSFYQGTIGANKRKMAYLPPKMKIEGNGIKRGLTAVEAAILMEQPMDKVLTMILFGTLKKEAATVIQQEPLEIELMEPLPEGLHPYEADFLNAFKLKGAQRRTAMQKMIVDLINSVSKKMKGFSHKETVAYYEDIMRRAWKMVEESDTPEVKSERYNQTMEWTMLDGDYQERTRRTFTTGPVFVPIWWPRYSPTYRRTIGGTVSNPIPTRTTSAGGGRVSLPNIPGSNFAAGVINGATGMAAGVVGNLTSFTSDITTRTNPIPTTSTSGSGGFRGGGGGGGSSCACACACAGCACACAGGGR
jgi:hypothetical protein